VCVQLGTDAMVQASVGRMLQQETMLVAIRQPIGELSVMTLQPHSISPLSCHLQAVQRLACLCACKLNVHTGATWMAEQGAPGPPSLNGHSSRHMLRSCQ
jgi:hypothetical protein